MSNASNETAEAVRKMNAALAMIGGHLRMQGNWSIPLSEFITDVVHATSHRMADSLTTQLAVVLLQRMNAAPELAQVLVTGLQATEADALGDMAHDVTLQYCTDLNLGLVGEGHDVMIAYLGSHFTKYAGDRLDVLGFAKEGDESTQDLTD